jgi:hypothetical protein
MYNLFVWLFSHQPAVLFSQNKPATGNQPAVLFSHNKPAPTISHQPNEQAGSSFRAVFLPHAGMHKRWSLQLLHAGMHKRWSLQLFTYPYG